MRKGRPILSVVTISLVGGLVFGCQYIAGVAGLEANAGGGGGEGGAGGSGGSTIGAPCESSADCGANGLCIGPMGMSGKCAACGTAPTPQAPPPCSSAGCDVCEDETCVTHCQAPPDCVGDQKLDAFLRPARLVCIGQCNDITVTCSGANACEVYCDGGGCQNLVLQCSGLGACKLTCKAGACSGASIDCGENSCLASCAAATPVTQTCNGSCDCKKQTCL
jgi:hypothetical protein